jgi:hypothetical protein
MVRLWARFNNLFGYHEDWKSREALQLAERMTAWRERNVIPDPRTKERK